MTISHKGFLSTFLLIILFLSALTSLAQNRGTIQDVMDGEAQIAGLLHKMQSTPDRQRLNQLNDSLFASLDDVLRMHAAFNYPFDSLFGIAKISSPDNDLRIFTWELPDPHGRIHYYGFITTPNCERVCEVIPLHEIENQQKITEYSQHGSHDWPGALYYAMQKVKVKKQSYYVLLGINRNSDLTKKKYLEILSLGDSVTFGKEVFVSENNNRFKRRLYEYSIEADMSLFFEEEGRIVMDHLSPSNPNFTGRFQYYVPDLSFDALELKKGLWIYKPDYDGREHRSLKDRFYNMELPEQQKLY